MTEHAATMDRHAVLEAMTTAHAELEGILASLDAAQLTQPGVYDELSVRDIVAHIGAWEQMAAGWVETTLEGGVPLAFAPGFEVDGTNNEAQMNRLNAYIFEQSRTRALADVLTEERAAHERLLAVVSRLSTADLNDPERFAPRNGIPLLTLIAGNSYDHIREHIDLIRAWQAGG